MEKMVSADIKANQNNKTLWLYLTNFFKEVPSKLEMQCKKGFIFHLILVGILLILILSVNSGVGLWVA